MKYNKGEFIEFVRGTLIPDLKESGSNATAADFEAACQFMSGAHIVSISNDGVMPVVKTEE